MHLCSSEVWVAANGRINILSLNIPARSPLPIGPTPGSGLSTVQRVRTTNPGRTYDPGKNGGSGTRG